MPVCVAGLPHREEGADEVEADAGGFKGHVEGLKARLGSLVCLDGLGEASGLAPDPGKGVGDAGCAGELAFRSEKSRGFEEFFFGGGALVGLQVDLRQVGP